MTNGPTNWLTYKVGCSCVHATKKARHLSFRDFFQNLIILITFGVMSSSNVANEMNHTVILPAIWRKILWLVKSSAMQNLSQVFKYSTVCICWTHHLWIIKMMKPLKHAKQRTTLFGKLRDILKKYHPFCIQSWLLRQLSVCEMIQGV